jgi:hypothetical protein
MCERSNTIMASVAMGVYGDISVTNTRTKSAKKYQILSVKIFAAVTESFKSSLHLRWRHMEVKRG